MKIELIVNEIVSRIPNEATLLDESTMESIYVIRKLKAALIEENRIIEVTQTNKFGQAYLEDYEIWIDKEEYMPYTGGIK